MAYLELDCTMWCRTHQAPITAHDARCTSATWAIVTHQAVDDCQPEPLFTKRPGV